MALFGALVLMACLRLLALTADSPLAPFWLFDEGHWVHNARNKLLFDEWVLDDFNQGLVTPVFTALTYLAFQVLGIGLWQARLVSALTGILTVIVFYYWLKKAWHWKAAAVATLLLSTNFLLFNYNRVALPETVVVFFLVLAGFFWSGAEGRPSHGLASGIAFMLACAAKPTALFFFVVPIVTWILKPAVREQDLSLAARLLQVLRRPHREPVGLFLLGCGLILVAALAGALALGVLPDLAAMLRLLAWGKHPDSLMRSVFRVLILPTREFFRTIPDLLLLTSLYFVLRGMRVTKVQGFLKGCTPVELTALAWLAFGALFVSLSTLYADRYFVMLIPPFCILGGKALSDVAGNAGEIGVPATTPTTSSWPWTGLLALLLFAPLLSILWPVLDRAIGGTSFEVLPMNLTAPFLKILAKAVAGSTFLAVFGVLAYRSLRRQQEMSLTLFMTSIYPALVLIWAFLTGTIFLLGSTVSAGIREGLSVPASAALALIVTLVLTQWIVRMPPRHRSISHLAARGSALLLAAVLLINGLQIVWFLSVRTYDVATAARQLQPYLSRGTVILGDMADTLALESEAVTLRSFSGFVENRTAVERFRPDYFLREVNMSVDAPLGPDENLDATRFVQRFRLFPLDRQGTSHTFVIDLFAVEGQPQSSPSSDEVAR
jgi:hypothetical protein